MITNYIALSESKNTALKNEENIAIGVQPINTKRNKNALLISMFALISIFFTGFRANAQVNLTATGGTLSQSYTTLKGAFDAINLGTHTGTITIGISGNTDETTLTAILNASGSGAASYTGVAISPTGGAARTITGATTAGAPLIDLNGADNVVINGLNSGGNSLTIANTTVSATSGTSTIRFIGGATNNTITNCNVQGSGTMSVATNGAVIFFSTDAVTANGNDNNIISNNNIGPAGANLPTKGILGNGSTTTTAIGNSNITIIFNNIFDYFGAAVTSSGIATNGGCNGWTILDNRFYQTGTRTWTTGAQHNAINIANTTATSGAQGFSITGNIVGYSSNTQTGTYTLTGSTGTFRGIVFNGITGSTSSNISINTIASISVTGVTSSGTSSTSPFIGIYVTNGVATTNNNTIGSQSATGSLVYSTTSASAADMIGMFNFSLDAWTANTNNIGGLTSSNAGTGAANAYGLRLNTGSAVSTTLNGNTIGGTIANSIQSTSTAAGSQVAGIFVSTSIATVSNNIIRNLTAAGGTGTTTAASVVGIDFISATPINNASLNTIYNLSNTNTAAATIVTAIQFTGGNGNVVERNYIYGLTNATNSASAELNGIRVAGGTTIYRNNMIALGGNVSNAFGSAATNSSTSGINGFNGFLGTDSFFHNTIYIGGSATTGAGPSYAFNGTQVVNTRSFRDNIFVNNRANSGATGTHYIIKMNGTVPNPTGLTLNNNVYFGAGTFGFYNSLDVANLAAWKTAVGQDGASFYSNPQLLNPTLAVPDLHINPGISSVAEGNGADVGVTLDFDGQTRSGLTPVDIGADAGNFIGVDLSAPDITYTVLANTGLTSNRILSVTITDVTGVNNTPGSRPRVYYNKNAGAYFSTEATLSSGSATNGVWTCTIDYSLIGGVVATDVIRYFVVAQDVLGNLSANPSSGFVGTNVTTVTTPPTTPNSYTIIPSFNGAINVGTTELYTSLTNTGGIFEAINGGALAGNVTINITSDLLTELGTVALNQWTEDGAGNYTLTINPSGAPRTITGTNGGALIKINGADRVTIDGSTTAGTAGSCLVGGDAALRELTIQNTNVGVGACVIAVQTGTNGAQNNTIKNVNILGQSSTTSLVGISLGGNTPLTVGTDNDNNRVENCTVKRVINGIYSSGVSVANQNLGTVITKNDLSATGADRVGRVGIVVFSENGINITYNNVGGIASSESSDAIGIAVGTNAISVNTAAAGTVANASIDHNKISGVTQDATFSAVGITLAGDVVGTNTISNNMISGIIGDSNQSDFIAGIFVTGGAASNAKLYYNTVSLTGDRNSVLTPATLQFPSYALAIGGTDLVVELKNNIFHNTQFVDLVANPNAKSYAIGMSSAAFVNLNSNYNDFWSAGANDAGFRTGSLTIAAGVDYATVALWSAAVSDDVNSVEIEPFFVTPTDLHLIEATNIALNNLGTPIATVTTDFDCITRNAVATDMGADEIGCTSAVGGTATALVTTFCASGSTTISATGYSTGETTSYQWQYSADAGFTTPIDFGSPSVIYDDLTTGIITTTTYYRLAVTCVSNGLASFSSVATVIIDVTPPPALSATINVTITDNCTFISGVYNDVGVLNGKRNFEWSNDSNFHMSFDGVKWVLWCCGNIADTGFENTNVPAGLYPPTSGWIPTGCGAGTLTVVNPDTVSLCSGATVADLVAIGTSIQWYDVASGGAALSNATPLVSGIYYVTQTLSGCESAAAPLFVSVNPAPTITLSSNSPVCAGNAINLTASPSSGYAINSNSGVSFVDISGTGTSVGTIADDSEHNITMPSFTFNGVPYTTARVGNNGLIVFGSANGEIEYNNQTLPSTFNSAGNIFLAPFWDDLYPNQSNTTNIKTQTIGNLFIIQYTLTSSFEDVNFENGTGTITFQVQLNTATGAIHYVYQDVLFGNPSFDSGVSATIGIQTSSTNAVQYSYNTASLVNGQSITFTPNLATYAWSGQNGFTSTLQNPSISNATATEEGTYTLIVTNPVTGCSSVAVNFDVSVEGLALPLTITQTGVTTLCNQQSVQLCSSLPARNSSIYALAAFATANSIAKYTTNFTTHTLVSDNTYTGPSSEANYGLDRNPITGQVYLIKNIGGIRKLFTIDLATNAMVDKGPVLSTSNSNLVQDFTFDNSGNMYAVFQGGIIEKINYNIPALTPTAFASGLSTNGGVGLTYDFDANRLLHTSGITTFDLYQISSTGSVSFMYSYTHPGPSSQAIEYVGNNTCYVSGTFDTNLVSRLDLITQATALVLTPTFVLNVKDLMYVPGVTLAWSQGVNSLGNTTCINVNPSSTTTYTLTLTNTDFGCSVTSTHTVNVSPCNSIVNLKLFIEGYYDSGAMRPVKNNQDGVSPIDEVEDITVELHDVAFPYGVLHTTTATLKTDGTAVCTFPTSPTGLFYVAVKTSNVVQTWSANPQSLNPLLPLTYDFSSGVNKAYEDNMIDIGGGVFGFYSGDINQDDVVDGSDATSLEDDIYNSESGVRATDLNGDGSVDGSDATFFANNSFNSIFAHYPQ